MSKRTVSYGKCFFCGKPYASRGMSRHLKACKERQGANLAESGRSGWPGSRWAVWPSG